MRILAAESSVDMNKLRGSRQMEDRDWTDVAVAYNPVSNAPLFIDDSPNLTMPEIRSKALRMKQQHDLGAHGHRLPPAHELGQARRVAPAGGLRVLPLPSSCWPRSWRSR